MLEEMLKRARAGQPLWLPDVRDAFMKAESGVPLILRLKSFDGGTRDWSHVLPRWNGAEERGLVRDYLCASVYNALSACGGYEVRFFLDKGETDVMALLAELPELFQVSAKKRRGLGKVVSVADRMGRAFGGEHFAFAVSDIAAYRPEASQSKPAAPALGDTLRALCAVAENVNCVGVDIGGTDIKLAASAGGRLIAVKEYDWDPSAFTTAEQLLQRILLLVRLMSACTAAELFGASDIMRAELGAALKKDARTETLVTITEGAELFFGDKMKVFDAVGVSFPDIVLRDRIVGGETPKTDGIRRAAADYETEFAKLGALEARLLELCRGQGHERASASCCRIVNDGNMAAFTAAMELACGGAPEMIGRGVIAHSLGTDLGTGWLDERGEIPQLPLELYDLWLDLGSFPSAALPPEDLRSTRNENSGLPGMRRYLGQAAAYRLAWELDPRLLAGFAEEKNGALRIAMEPDDLRKPCLEYLMRQAGEGDAAAEEIFRQIGRHLAVVSREAEQLLRLGTNVRFLFGRFVKSERCFTLLREGCAEFAQHIRLENGGEDLVETPLMRQLAQRKDVTVAQFAQAIGALYFALI